MSGVWIGRQAGQPSQSTVEGRGCRQCLRPSCHRSSVRALADYRWSAGTSGRKIRDTLLDNVDIESAASSDRESNGDGSAAARPQNGSRNGGNSPEAFEERAAAADTAQSEDPSAAPERQGPEAWDKARLTPAVDNGWGPGIPELDREDWDWGASSSGRAPSINSNAASSWSQQGSQPAADSSWRDLGSDEGTAGDAADTGAWDNDAGEAGAAGGELPDIVELRRDEAVAIFPGAPTAEQIQYCSGDSVTLWQRLGVSLLLTLVTLKTTALAAGTFTFPIWYPSLRAALRNRSIKGKYRWMGLWRVAVMEVEVVLRYGPRFQQPNGRATVGREERLLRLLVGDTSGARSQLSVPYQKRYDAIRTGETAEVVVLSRSRKFESFKALKEVYLPECGLWVSDYPFLNREAYLECSLEIERERQQEAVQGYR
ncbi:hypothetical protein CVIRNUC_009836 [Coccomyxa viridis]|uniref:Uncharacterized protein n=1 Tax=Coccomyxa viridis TaxID=1274662 RepID=A0AAV1IIW9_9CHLO|nr:hypothetical protein CVIRNUC_009836 [Coccomyxa viridis]